MTNLPQSHSLLTQKKETWLPLPFQPHVLARLSLQGSLEAGSVCLVGMKQDFLAGWELAEFTLWSEKGQSQHKRGDGSRICVRSPMPSQPRGSSAQGCSELERCEGVQGSLRV